MLMTANEIAAMETGAQNFGALPRTELSEQQSLARKLAYLAGDGNVRLMEALACVIVRSDWGQICSANSMGPSGHTIVMLSDSPIAAAADRVVRRALAGSISDLTHGATRFHKLGALPEWAKAACPVAEIGDYLFYCL